MKEAVPVVLLVLILATAPVMGHGASRGLHIHLAPEPAAAGTTVTVTLDAAEPLRSASVGWVDGDALTMELEQPSRHVRLKLRLPEKVEDPVINLHAEVVTVAGSNLRAAAVLRVDPLPGKPKSR